MTKAQLNELRAREGINQGEEWDKFAGLDVPTSRGRGASSPTCRSCRRARGG